MSPSEKKYDVFLSYSKADVDIVRGLAELLKKSGLEVWFDEWEIKVGAHVGAQVDLGLKSSRNLICCYSKNLLKSDWGLFEAGAFRFRDPMNRMRRLITLRLDSEQVDLSLAPFLHLDWFNEEERSLVYEKLLNACRTSVDLKSELLSDASFKLNGKSDTPTVAIIGMGFAGVTTAIRLMQLSSVPIRLLLFEAKEPQRYGGLAYGSGGLHREHYLNIHAGRISIYRERPDDFLKWAAEDAKISDWLRVLNIDETERQLWEQKLNFTESSAVPRVIYSQYLKDRFEQAKQLAKATVCCEHISGNVYDLELEDSNSVLVHYNKLANQSGHNESVKVDVCVLCTGHMNPLLPDCVVNEANILNHASFFKDPYNPKYKDQISRSNVDDELLIIGSGLSAYDAAVTAATVGYKGKVTMCSRNGFRHNSYPQNHSHSILSSLCFNDLFKVNDLDYIVTANEMHKAIKTAIKRAEEDLFSRCLPVEHKSVIPERVLKAIEPHIRRFVQKADASEVKAFLSDKTRITTLRTSVVPEVTAKLGELEVKNRTEVVEKIAAKGDSVLSVCFRSTKTNLTEEKSFRVVVCCLGYNPDYSQIQDGLWGNIMRKYVMPHPKTGLGIRVGNNGKVILKPSNESSKPTVSRSLYAVGAMRQGNEMEENGRTGAFTFSIGTIRNQSLMTALSILSYIEVPGFRDIPRIARIAARRLYNHPLSAPGEAMTKFEELVSDIADVQFLPNTEGRNDWLRRLEDEIYDLVPARGITQSDLNLARYDLWHSARRKAGRLVTDIRHLSERYAQVRSYRPGEQSRCVKERKDCKDIIKVLMRLLNANSVSISVYSKERECLFPFVDHLRLDDFTPTRYGQNNAGLLVKAYAEMVPEERLSPDYFQPGEILPYYENGRILGMVIKKYSLTGARKQNYKEKPRVYDHLLLSLIIKAGEVVGVLYFEATPDRKFQAVEVRNVLEKSGKLSDLISKVALIWDPQPDDDCQDQMFDGKEFPENSNFKNKNFTNSTLNKVTMEKVDLTSALLNGVQCRWAYFDKASLRGVKMVGAEMTSSSFSNADMSGAIIYGSTFSKAKLSNVLICGASIDRSNFEGAELIGVRIAGACIRNVDFSSANFQRARFSNTAFKECILPRGLQEWRDCRFTECIMDEGTHAQLPLLIRQQFRSEIKVFKSLPDYPLIEE